MTDILGDFLDLIKIIKFYLIHCFLTIVQKECI